MKICLRLQHCGVLCAFRERGSTKRYSFTDVAGRKDVSSPRMTTLRVLFKAHYLSAAGGEISFMTRVIYDVWAEFLCNVGLLLAQIWCRFL